MMSLDSQSRRSGAKGSSRDVFDSKRDKEGCSCSTPHLIPWGDGRGFRMGDGVFWRKTRESFAALLLPLYYSYMHTDFLSPRLPASRAGDCTCGATRQAARSGRSLLSPPGTAGLHNSCIVEWFLGHLPPCIFGQQSRTPMSRRPPASFLLRFPCIHPCPHTRIPTRPGLPRPGLPRPSASAVGCPPIAVSVRCLSCRTINNPTQTQPSLGRLLFTSCRPHSCRPHCSITKAGLVWDLPLRHGAHRVGALVHKGEQKAASKCCSGSSGGAGRQGAGRAIGAVVRQWL
jgi:hypothetical protein